jgi:hypothetical protein
LERKKKECEIVVRLSFFFFGSCEFLFLFGMRTKLDDIFLCALFTYDGPTYMTNAFFVVSVTDSGSTQQDVAGVLAH